mmetsp:Transcript_43950/g.95594  ORF Transcript_43950/g.95594 Transcript_43950/m.95594 type:complete len:206 (-) Transcript_43950:2013-2630(-)
MLLRVIGLHEVLKAPLVPRGGHVVHWPTCACPRQLAHCACRRGHHHDPPLDIDDAEVDDGWVLVGAPRQPLLTRAAVVRAHDRHRFFIWLACQRVDLLRPVPVANDAEGLHSRAPYPSMEPPPIWPFWNHLLNLAVADGADDEIGVLIPLEGLRPVGRLPRQPLLRVPPLEGDLVDGAYRYPIKTTVDEPILVVSLVVGPQDLRS